MSKLSFAVKYSFQLESEDGRALSESKTSAYTGTSAPVVFDMDRMKAALACPLHALPAGLGREERRKRILAVANRRK